MANTRGIKMGMVEPWIIEFLEQIRRENDAIKPELLRERVQMPVRVWPGEREPDASEPTPEIERPDGSTEDYLGC
jgi:hypothetical protein